MSAAALRLEILRFLRIAALYFIQRLARSRFRRSQRRIRELHLFTRHRARYGYARRRRNDNCCRICFRRRTGLWWLDPQLIISTAHNFSYNTEHFMSFNTITNSKSGPRYQGRPVASEGQRGAMPPPQAKTLPPPKLW